MNKDTYILDKINFCLGVSSALSYILLNLSSNNDLSEQKYNSILALAECLDEKLNLLANELRNNL